MDRQVLGRFPALRRLGRAGARGRVPVIRQLAQTECGLACLAMVLAYHGKEVGRDAIRRVLGAGRDGTTARHILGGARHFGLRGRGLRLDVDALACLRPATILHWSFNHFVVFERLVKRGAEIVDPAFGRRTVSLEELGRCFTGIAVELEPSEAFAPGPIEGPSAWGRLARRVLRAGEWGRILALSFFVLLLSLALPLATSAAVDRVIPRGDHHLLLVLSVAVGGLMAFHFVTALVRAHLLLHLRVCFDVGLTMGLVERLTSLAFHFFQRRSSGDLMARLNSSVFIQEIVTTTLLTATLDGGLMGVYAILLFALSPATGALVLALGALQVGAFLVTRARQRDANALMLARQARSQGYQVEMLAGMETLKAMGCEDIATRRWADLYVDVMNAYLDRGRLNAALEAVQGTLRMATPLLLLGVGVHRALDGAMPLGAMLALNTFALGVFLPLSNLVATASQVQLLGGYLERIADIEEADPEQDRGRVHPAGALRGRVALDRVSFRYGPLDPLVVSEVSLGIEPGQLVAIVGRTGSGKSTLASLILGLYPPTEGKVLYDGISLEELELQSVRRQLGIVTQQTHLFGGTIRQNIALSDPDLPLDAVVEAATLAQIHEDIARMPMGYETLLSDGGGAISGGQRQRLALARALVRRPAILLLDEATSALDAVTEQRVQEALQALSCTKIVIAHRLSTIRGADCILVMDGGRLVERGTHAELTARGGHYARLVATQAGDRAPPCGPKAEEAVPCRGGC